MLPEYGAIMTGMRARLAIGLLAATAACSRFGSVDSPGADAATTEAGVAEAGADGGEDAPIVFGDGGANVCASGDYVFCADFEDGTTKPFAASDELKEMGGTLTVETLSDGHKGLKAFLPACACSGQGVHAMMEHSLDHDGFAGVAPIAVDYAMEYEAALTQSSSADTNFSTFGVFSQLAANPLFTADVYINKNGISLTAQDPTFRSAGAAVTAPQKTRLLVHLEVDFATDTIALWMGTPGATPTKIGNLAGGAKTVSPPLRLLAGIQRYNDPTPDITVIYDYITVKRQ
jgi:hypothetical protein